MTNIEEKKGQQWIIKNIIPKNGLHFLCAEKEEDYFFCLNKLINSFKNDENIFCGEKVKDCPVVHSFLSWTNLEETVHTLVDGFKMIGAEGLALIECFVDEEHIEAELFEFMSSLFKIIKQTGWTVFVCANSGNNLSKGFITYESFKNAIGQGIEIKNKNLHIFKKIGKDPKKIFKM